MADRSSVPITAELKVAMGNTVIASFAKPFLLKISTHRPAPQEMPPCCTE
ncbi:hypothetical protein EVA_14340 [gut metagenome]|uniref:Uncharacterized protein n=1 Tax=gut metagenome TaxID=749906 RepID=J9GDX5_9ZZZZ